MKCLTIFTIFSVAITLGNSAPTFLEWFGFDTDELTTLQPDGEELIVTTESNIDTSTTDMPYDTTQILTEETTESQQYTETTGTELTTDGSGSGDASTTTLPSLESVIDKSGDSDDDYQDKEYEAQEGKQDGNINIENPENQNNENIDGDNSVQPENEDPWKELEDELNKEWGQDYTNEDDSKQDEDDNTNEEEAKQNNEEGDDSNDKGDDSNDEDENAKEAIKEYIKEYIERSCSYEKCNDECQVQRHYGGHCKYGSRCICF